MHINFEEFRRKPFLLDLNVLFVGLRFWKVGSRKLFAIRGGKRRKRQLVDSDSDEEMSQILQSIDTKVAKSLDVTNKFQFPIGFSSLLNDTFMCKICRTTITPPAIFGRCCRTIIGCQVCVDRWYRGDRGLEKKCPLCRGDRGFADTCQILGLDEFLVAAEKLLNSRRTISAAVPSPPSTRDFDSDDLSS